MQACFICFYRDLAHAFDAAGQVDSAIVMLERFVEMPTTYSLDARPGSVQLAMRRLGELYEARGNSARATLYYSRFVALWKNADDDLQPQVADVQRRLERLSRDN